MHRRFSLRSLSVVFLVPAYGVAQDLQPGPNFVAQPGDIAQTTSFAETVRLGDFDQDGDLDAFFTAGGSFSNAQSRLWTSNATTAGVSFSFSDATPASLPILLAQSQSAEAADIDGDGDLDLAIANTSQFFAQSNVWLVNQGGAQGGTPGTFLLDMSRWNGLGGAGSSVAAALVLSSGTFSGGFADWSHALEFGDVDLDGDLDLLQASIGPSFGGSTLHRMFLNEGTNGFEEHNPSGAVSGATALATGSSAGWCEGTQLEGTPNTTGAQHDLTGVSYDIDFGDLDQDLDLDVLVQGRASSSRVYRNRYIENGDSLGNEGIGQRLFRDVTASVLATPQTGGLCQDVELFDADADDDLDLWGVNWSGLQDRLLLNDGTGILASAGGPLGDPGADENEADVLDYDGDGDLDVAVANFQGTNWIYKSLAAQGASTATTSTFLVRTSVLGTETEMATPGTVADSFRSGDVGDLDNDGDDDLIFSQGGLSTLTALQQNLLGVPDSIAPRLPLVTSYAGLLSPTSAPRRIVAQVYDNAAMERLRDASAEIEFTVDGGAPKIAPARWSGGNLVRGTIPGWWTGSIQYVVRVTDRAGNAGTSAAQVFTVASQGLASYGAGTPGCSGAQAMAANSAPTIGNVDFELSTTNCPPSSLQLTMVSDAQDLAGSDPFGLGVTLHVGFGGLELIALDMFSDAAGFGVASVAIPPTLALIGQTYFAQTLSAWAGPCVPSTFGLSTSDGLAMTVLP